MRSSVGRRMQTMLNMALADIGFLTGSCGRNCWEVMRKGECGVSAAYKITKTLMPVLMTLNASLAHAFASTHGVHTCTSTQL